MESVYTLIGAYGFPIVMCLLFFFQMKKSIDANTNAIVEMKTLITKLIAKLDKDDEK